MTAVNENLILSELKKIVDPSQQKDIVSLGYIASINIKDSNVSFVMEVPVHRGPALEPIRKLAEKALLGLPSITSATGILTSHDDKKQIKDLDADNNRNQEKVFESNIKHFIAVGSGKGGVGKSTTSVNIAICLKLLGKKVGILDADVYGPSLPRMLGISGRPNSLGGDVVSPLENYGIKMMSIGLLVPDDTAMIWRGPMVQSALTQMLNSVDWGELDVMIVDLPPGTGDIQISLAQQVNLSGVVVVSTPQDIALLDVSKSITMFQKAQVNIIGMVQNMSFWKCPDCGREDHIFGSGGVDRETSKRNIELLGNIPLELTIRKGSDSGMPFVISEPESKSAEIYMSISKKIIKFTESLNNESL